MIKYDLHEWSGLISDEKQKEYFKDHKWRFEQSLKWISPHVKETSHVLEIGSPGVFTDIFKKHVKCEKYYNTWQDLRTPIDYPDSMFDVILFMEVIEHVKDVEEVGGYNETFHGTGQLNLLKECHRMLKNEGILFFTTPNPNSIASLRKLLAYDHPFTYWFHVREMSQNDIKNNIEKSNLKIIQYNTLGCWYKITQTDRQLMECLEKFGYSSEYREDDIFIIAKK